VDLVTYSDIATAQVKAFKEKAIFSRIVVLYCVWIGMKGICIWTFDVNACLEIPSMPSCHRAEKIFVKCGDSTLVEIHLALTMVL
jgi:hypothetical protein